jgi:Tol biopolymer transport system component
MYIVDLDGQVQKLYADIGGDVVSYVVSDDGQYIAMILNKHTSYPVVIRNLQGEIIAEVANTEIHMLGWSHDGSKLSFYEGINNTIFSINIETLEQEHVAQLPTYASIDKLTWRPRMQ